MTTEYTVRFSAYNIDDLIALKDFIENDGCRRIDVFATHDEKRPYWFSGTAFDDDELVYAGAKGVFAMLSAKFPGVKQATVFQNRDGFGILTSSFELRQKGIRQEDDLSPATVEMFETAAAGPLTNHDIRRFLKSRASLNGMVDGHSFLWKLASGENSAMIHYCVKNGMLSLGIHDDPIVIAKAVMPDGTRALRKQIAGLLTGAVSPHKSPLSLMNDAVKSNDPYAAAGSLLLGLNLSDYIESHPAAEPWLKKLLS